MIDYNKLFLKNKKKEILFIKYKWKIINDNLLMF